MTGDADVKGGRARQHGAPLEPPRDGPEPQPGAPLEPPRDGPEPQPGASPAPQGTKRIIDTETLKALTHPLRLRLLGLLRLQGPATATELAKLTDESSGSTSYHLRQLARFGFIEEDPEQPGGRDRRWRPVHRYTAWQAADFLDEPGGREASEALERHQRSRQSRLFEQWLAIRGGMDRRWLQVAGASDDLLRLTPSQARQLQQELFDLISRYRENPPTPTVEAVGQGETATEPEEPTAYVATYTELLPFEEPPL